MTLLTGVRKERENVIFLKNPDLIKEIFDVLKKNKLL